MRNLGMKAFRTLYTLLFGVAVLLHADVERERFLCLCHKELAKVDACT